MVRTSKSARTLLNEEIGTIHKEAQLRVALVYPSPYHVAMSSLGYQSIYRALNDEPQVAADRAMLPEGKDPRGPLRTLERDKPIGAYSVIAFSVAYELELTGLLTCLSLADIPVLCQDRSEYHPLIIAGGPLTFSNPAPLAPFCDLLLLGESETLAPAVARAALEHSGDKAELVAQLAKLPGVYAPRIHGETVPPVCQVDDDLLPACSVILTPNTELRSMFLTEVARGCSRGCTYCVMRRSTNGGMRIIDPERIFAAIPEHARRVGLVGAAVTDHPKITHIVRHIVTSGRQIGISSLRADRLSEELVGLLASGGYRTLTVALDGASERLRANIERKTYERHLFSCAQWAHRHRLKTLKMYMMVGLPGETDDDIDELCRFVKELRKIHSRIAIGVAPFVAKRHTPLDGSEFMGVREVEQRLKRLRQGLRGIAEVRPTSARWAWVEYMLAQGDAQAGLATLDAWKAGASFADFKHAFAERGLKPTGPRARVLSTPELVALRAAR